MYPIHMYVSIQVPANRLPRQVKVQIAESLGSAIGRLTNRLQVLVAMWSWPRVNFEVLR